jgi:hypothetical protein
MQSRAKLIATLFLVSALGACSKAQQARVAVQERSMVPPGRWRNLPNKYDAELHKMGMPPAPPIYIAPPPLPHPKNTKSDALVSFGHKKIHGISFYQSTIDLSQKSQYMSILLPHDVAEANSVTVHHGAENFAEYVRLHKCAVMTNGTFFSKDKQERVLGNLRADGQSLKYSPWEDYGTTFAIKKDNVLEMVTARQDLDRGGQAFDQCDRGIRSMPPGAGQNDAGLGEGKDRCAANPTVAEPLRISGVILAIFCA